MNEQEKFMFDTLRIRFGNEPLYKKVSWIDRVLEMSSNRSWDEEAEMINRNYDRNNEEEVQRIISLLLPAVLDNSVERQNRLRWLAYQGHLYSIDEYPRNTDEERQQTLFDIEPDVIMARRRQGSLCYRLGLLCGVKRSRRTIKRRAQIRKTKRRSRR